MKKHNVEKCKLTLSFYKEGKHFIAFCPSLDLTAYGDTFEEARKAFEETAVIFFEEVTKKGTLEDVLTECGWSKVSKGPSHWRVPKFITTVEEEVAVPV